MIIYHIYEEDTLEGVAITKEGAFKKARELAQSKMDLIKSVNKEAIELKIETLDDGILLKCEEIAVFSEVFVIKEQEVIE